MRIISTLIVLLALLILFGAQVANASDLTYTNETEIKFNIQSNGPILLAYEPGHSNPLISALAHKKTDPEKSPEEIKRDTALAKRYGAKLEKAVFPKGKFTINASAYTAAADECGKSDGITASGLKVMEKRTLACPPQYPLGAKINIEGYGIFVCEDRGGAIKGNHFDIYVETKKEAFAFGRRNLTAEFIL